VTDKAMSTAAEILAGVMAKELYLIENRCLVEPQALAPLLGEHLLYAIELEKSGKLFASGPLFDRDAATGHGVTIVRAASFEEAEAIAARDPFAVAGVRVPAVHRWIVNEGRISVSVDISDQRAALP
jgi:uncharacterized protein YciI